MKIPVESQDLFSLPTGHHTRWFCERRAKVGGKGHNPEGIWEIFWRKLLKWAMVKGEW